jgi:hypothetical protein
MSDDLPARLAARGREYQAATTARDTARLNLDTVVVEALRAQMEIGEIVALSTLAPATVQKVRRGADLPPAPRGGYRKRP